MDRPNSRAGSQRRAPLAPGLGRCPSVLGRGYTSRILLGIPVGVPVNTREGKQVLMMCTHGPGTRVRGPGRAWRRPSACSASLARMVRPSGVSTSSTGGGGTPAGSADLTEDTGAADAQEHGQIPCVDFVVPRQEEDGHWTGDLVNSPHSPSLR